MRRPIDTSAETRERQLEAYRAMSPERRLRLADEMTSALRELAGSGRRARDGVGRSDNVDDGAVPGKGPRISANE